ncbi:unnamed protein product [Eretmochelys imbricata]
MAIPASEVGGGGRRGREREMYQAGDVAGVGNGSWGWGLQQSALARPSLTSGARQSRTGWIIRAVSLRLHAVGADDDSTRRGRRGAPCCSGAWAPADDRGMPWLGNLAPSLPAVGLRPSPLQQPGAAGRAAGAGGLCSVNQSLCERNVSPSAEQTSPPGQTSPPPTEPPPPHANALSDCCTARGISTPSQERPSKAQGAWVHGPGFSCDPLICPPGSSLPWGQKNKDSPLLLISGSGCTPHAQRSAQQQAAELSQSDEIPSPQRAGSEGWSDPTDPERGQSAGQQLPSSRDFGKCQQALRYCSLAPAPAAGPRVNTCSVSQINGEDESELDNSGEGGGRPARGFAWGEGGGWGSYRLFQCWGNRSGCREKVTNQQGRAMGMSPAPPSPQRTLSPTAVPTGTRGALLWAGISRCCCYPSWNTSTDWQAGERFLRSRQGRCRVTRVPATRGDFPMAQAGGAAFRPCRCPRRAASPPPPKSPRVPHASGQVSTAPRQRLTPEQR